MRTYVVGAGKGVPVMEYPAPEGVVNVGGEWYYNEFARGGVSSVGVSGSAEAPAASPSRPAPASEERKSILDLFRN